MASKGGVKKVKGYDQFKEFEGRRYTGMKVGRRHKWKYEAGEWLEKKVTPDDWEFEYAVKKRRAGKAPEGSGAPVGTSYNWYILARQIVTKIDANTYTTEMVGTKHKLAHKRADQGGKQGSKTASWSASDRAQRRHLAKILRAMLDDLEKDVQDDAHPVAAPRTLGRPKPAQNRRVA
jgi:hypothetical protein